MNGRDSRDLTEEEREELLITLRSEVSASWLTDEIRRRKPTPEEESMGGMAVVEQSLCTLLAFILQIANNLMAFCINYLLCHCSGVAVPKFLRAIDKALKKHTGKGLPIDHSNITFGSWMGGDRDGTFNCRFNYHLTDGVVCR